MPDFDHLRRATAESIQGGLVLGLVHHVERAWRHSGLRQLVEQLRRTWADAPVIERTRLVALAAAIGAAINVLARAIMPPYTAPGLPITLMIAIAVVAAAVAAMPKPFVDAWRHSRMSRSKQR